MKKIKTILKKNWFWILLITLSVIKQIMVSCLPIFAISNGTHDDLMMVNMAECISRGWWLGEYTQYTLVKGIFFPMFLAVTNYIGISYLNASNLFYTLSSLFFVVAIGELFKNNKYQKIYMIIIFIVLLFNPLSYSSWTLQRLYRNGMTLSQALLIFGGLIGTYLRIDKPAKKNILWLLATGFGLATLANTREDAIWIYPFVIAIIGTICVKWLLNNKKESKKFKLRNILLFLIPIFMTVLTNLSISTINYAEYGVFTTNELNSGPFKATMKSIYSIKNKKNIEYVSVTREKLKRIYKMSPTLNSIKDELENRMDDWSSVDRNSNDKEVEDGWFFWTLRDAVDKAGYYKNAKKADEFYKNVSSEINLYVKKHNVKTVATMPSALMSPWRKGYGTKIIKTSAKILKYIVAFDEVKSENSASVDDGSNGVSRFEAISNESAYISRWKFQIKGWIFNRSNDELEFQIRDYDGNIIQKLNLEESEDVYDYYDKSYETSKKCRFKTEFNMDGSLLKLAVINKKTNETKLIDLEKNDYTLDDNNYEINIDYANKINEESVYQASVQKYIDRLNNIGSVYKIFNPLIFVITAIMYIIITVRFIKDLLEKKYDHICGWLIITSIVLSLMVLIVGVSYNEISSCASIRYMYLSGAYPLLLSFEFITIFYFIINFILKNEKKIKQKLNDMSKKIIEFNTIKGNKNKFKITRTQMVFIGIMFMIMFVWSLVAYYNYGPDEYMRYLVPKYIYSHGNLPLPNNKEVVVSAFNASYAYYPLLLGSIVSAFFMKIVSIFTSNSFALVVAARFTSVIAGTLFIYFMIKIANIMFKKSKVSRLFMIAFSSLIPQLTFLSSYVNNDIIALLGVSIVIYSWLLIIKTEFDKKNMSLLAVGISIIALSYYNAYGWILSSILFFIFTYLYKQKQKKEKFEFKPFIKKVLFVSCIVMLLISFLFVRNAVVNKGDFLGMKSFLKACEKYTGDNPNINPKTRDTPKNLKMTVWQAMWTKHYLGNTNYVERTSQSFVGVFGPMQFFVKNFIYNIYLVIITIGIVGCILRLKSNYKKREYRAFFGGICISMTITIILGIYYMYATDYQPQGRYLFPIFPGLAILVSIGIDKILELISLKIKNKHKFKILKIALYLLLTTLLIISYISANITFFESLKQL